MYLCSEKVTLRKKDNMKKICAFGLVALMAMTVISCGNQTASKETTDSLRTALVSTQNDYNELKDFLSVIATGLDSISAKETDIFNTSKESPVPNRQRIKEQLTVLKQSLEEQRTKINSLEQQMRADSKNAAMMKSVINMLKGQLEEKSNRIMELQAELDNKNLSIQELNTRVENLTSQNALQQETISAQQDMISTQDDMLNMGYVKIGTKQELKDKGLLSTGFLKKAKVDVSNVSKNLFKSVNIREYTEVTINSKKIKIMTQMPEESYTTEEKGGKTVLHINDPAKFWSISKFLIIMTD